jgi:serine/threonine protein kinase
MIVEDNQEWAIKVQSFTFKKHERKVFKFMDKFVEEDILKKEVEPLIVKYFGYEDKSMPDLIRGIREARLMAWVQNNSKMANFGRPVVPEIKSCFFYATKMEDGAATIHLYIQMKKIQYSFKEYDSGDYKNSFNTIFRKKPLSDQALFYYRFAENIDFLSKLEIVHHDIKLSNVLVDQDLNPYINDFGLSNFSNFQAFPGTKGYLSSDKYIGLSQKEIPYKSNIASDLHAFAVFVYLLHTMPDNEIVKSVLPLQKGVFKKVNDKFIQMVKEGELFKKTELGGLNDFNGQIGEFIREQKGGKPLTCGQFLGNFKQKSDIKDPKASPRFWEFLSNIASSNEKDVEAQYSGRFGQQMMVYYYASCLVEKANDKGII